MLQIREKVMARYASSVPHAPMLRVKPDPMRTLVRQSEQRVATRHRLPTLPIMSTHRDSKQFNKTNDE
jgi:hypothetical protein